MSEPGQRPKHRADEPQQDRETGGSHEGGTIRGIGVQGRGRRCLTPQVGTSDARLNESGATKSRRPIHLRYDRDDRPDQRGTAKTTTGQQNKHRSHAKNRQRGPADAGDKVTDKELTGSDKARVALEVGLDPRLLPNRARPGVDQKQAAAKPPCTRPALDMSRVPAVAVEYSHQASEGVCQILILTDTATAVARRS